MSDPDAKKNLEELHRKFVIVTIHKASNNFAFICRKYYIPKLTAKVIHNHKSLRRNLLKLTSNTAKNLTLK